MWPLTFRNAERLMLVGDHADGRDSIGVMLRNVEFPVQVGRLNHTECGFH
jgi:hypothetical protein